MLNTQFKKYFYEIFFETQTLNIKAIWSKIKINKTSFLRMESKRGQIYVIFNFSTNLKLSFIAFKMDL